MNLAASNLVTCLFLTTIFVLNSVTLSYTPSLCAISEAGTALVTTSSILSVLLIAVDQYFAVVDPLRYRTRVDKLKCGILIVSIWIIATVFGSLAAFNPNPRSLWRSCAKTSEFLSKFNENSTFNVDYNSDFLLFNDTEDLDLETQVEISEDDDRADVEEELELMENTTAILRTTFLESYRDFDPLLEANSNFTYGLIYSIVFSIFVYLLPFMTICWIYISIYSAARKNSERTRRTGSRPILSTGSFCEDYCPMKQELGEEFRRIPKISSLSSIEESSETPTSQITRSKSSEIVPSSNTNIDEKEQTSAVVFTVGSQEVEVAPHKQAYRDTKDTSKVPIASLKAKFLDTKDQSRQDNFVKSKFPDPPDQRRKSSYDLMYEEMMLQRKLSGISDSCEESSDEEMLSFMENKHLEDIKDTKSFNSLNHISSQANSSKLDNLHQINSNQIISSQNIPDHIIVSGDFSGQVLSEASRFLNVEHEIPSNGLVKSDDRKYISKISLNGAVMESSTSNLLNAPPNTPIVTITPPYKAPLHRVSSVKSTSSYINSLKYRISNGSVFKYREETRAARISALVIVMGLICWTPYVVVLILRNLTNDVFQRFDTIVLSFLVLSTYVSPLLFGYRSKRVKKELKKFFCFRKELSYKNNRSLMAKKVIKRRHSGNLSQFEMESKYSILNCVYGRTKWPKEKVHFVQVPETALVVETCRSSFSSGASTQISSTSTDEC